MAREVRRTSSTISHYPLVPSSAQPDDGAISWDKLPIHHRNIVRRMVLEARSQQRKQLLISALIALCAMLAVLIVVGVFFAR